MKQCDACERTIQEDEQYHCNGGKAWCARCWFTLNISADGMLIFKGTDPGKFEQIVDQLSVILADRKGIPCVFLYPDEDVKFVDLSKPEELTKDEISLLKQKCDGVI